MKTLKRAGAVLLISAALAATVSASNYCNCDPTRQSCVYNPPDGSLANAVMGILELLGIALFL